MNDAHIYCTPEQVAEEFNSVIAMYRRYYSHLRIGDFRVRLSLHEAGSEKYVDNEEEWIRSENIVRKILTENGIPFEEEVGEAAFYGPKIDIQIKNLLGREETVSTCQLDFVMADRFDLTYTDNEGHSQRPYIIHRAPLSTHERLVSFLIELYGGAFPTWLAPIQLQLIPVNEQVIPYANEIAAALRSDLIRVRVDDGSDKFNKKMRNEVTSKIPNMWILGNQEMEDRTITWRRYSVREQKTADLDDAIAAIKQLYAERMMDNFADVDLPLIGGDAE
jgi:threonyl-tRNA synthetase